MIKHTFFLAVGCAALGLSLGCGGPSAGGDTGDTGNSGDSGDSGNTGDAGNSGDTGNSGLGQEPL